MRVKIGDTWHDSNEEPICIQISEGEQKQIADLDFKVAPLRKYAIFPNVNDRSPEEMLDWMGYHK